MPGNEAYDQSHSDFVPGAEFFSIFCGKLRSRHTRMDEGQGLHQDEWHKIRPFQRSREPDKAV